jgi:DNA-directed RNA polymerase subunit K/omega
MNSKVNIVDYHDIIKSYNPQNNSTRNVLTIYEKVKIIGLRAEQLQRGAAPYVDFDEKKFDPIQVATQELHSRKLPFMICRTLPNGQKEYWRLDDMIII